MKNKFLQLGISALIFTTTISANAQSWSVTGNSNTIASTNFLETKDNKPLVLRTNNVERLRISSGVVGIGISNPSRAKFVTDGNVGNTMAIFGNSLHGIALVNDLPTIGFNSYYNSGSKALNAGYGGLIYVNQNVGDMQFATSTKGVSQGSSISTIVRMNIKQDGTIGIGTSSPRALLDVDTTTSSERVNTQAIYGLGQYGVGVEGSSQNGSGVYGLSTNYIGVYGYTGNPDWYAGYFAGNVYCSGTYLSSDQNLKQNISDFSSAIEIINQLHPKYYEYRHDGDYALMNLPQGNHYGLIAQEVEKVLPTLVKDSKFETKYAMQNVTDEKNSGAIDFKVLNCTELIPIMIKGMQEQEQTIESLQQVNKEEQQQIDELKKIVQTLSANQPITREPLITNSSVAYLKQK